MCCIFTCCGWMVDLIQRLWTFTMSCCISSAVCCSLVTASMSGVALGYNYSLAEYIDLKETNVSVYLKRGIFDDEIADDIDWRRSGRQPVAGHIGENNLLTASDESTTLRSGRRLDDSIYESNDRNNYEGALMKLTAKAPDSSTLESSSDVPLSELIKQYPSGSLDQLKAVQSAINMRKAAAAIRKINNKNQETSMGNERIEQRFGGGDISNRRAMKFDVPPFNDRSSISSLREAVPDDRINNRANWMLPKLPAEMIPKDMLYLDDYNSPTYPSPVTPRPGPVRPTRPRTFRPKPKSTTKPTPSTRSPEPSLPKSIDEEMDSFKGKLIVDKLDTSGLSDDEFMKKIKMDMKKSDEDYEEQIKGVPLRKKRNSFFLYTLKPIDYTSDKIEKNTDLSSEQDRSVASTTIMNSRASQDTLLKLLFSLTTS